MTNNPWSLISTYNGHILIVSDGGVRSYHEDNIESVIHIKDNTITIRINSDNYSLENNPDTENLIKVLKGLNKIVVSLTNDEFNETVFWSTIKK